MSHFFVPKDYSKAVEMVPDDEEIVYSTLCHVEFYMKEKEYWESHVLVTNRSVVFTKGKFKKPVQLYYLPWSAIKFVGREKFDSPPYRFKLKRDVQLETNEQFLERCQAFKAFIKPIKEEGKKYWKSNFHSGTERMAEVRRIVEHYLNTQKKGS
ncbi:MAG: hypothetical protein MUP85_04205 [Candidatus Lokiarchaeota archaeon]|nr:hypothetical protein [Candidatus Lokiarchaeota archaeon]